MAEVIPDVMVSFLGGQDASKSPGLIAQDAIAAGINLSMQEGAPQPRWGTEKLKLTFPEGGLPGYNGYIKSYKEIFTGGKYQASIYYSIGSDNFAVIVISGVIFLLNLKSKNVTVLELTPSLSRTAPRLNIETAANYVIIHDYPQPPVIIDGYEVRRSDPTKDEIPVSVMGTYNQNRLFISNGGNEFTGSDAVGNQATPDAPLTFLEVNTPSSPYVGQIFSLPTQYANEEVTAMTFLPLVDSSTGIGPLVISTKNAIYSYATNQPRASWEAGQFGSNLTFNAGIAGPKSHAAVNSDLFFISADGQVRSLSMSRDEQTKWAKVSISREVKNWLIYNDRSLIKYASVAYHKNKILFTANPYRLRSRGLSNEILPDYASAGAVVLELDNISSFGVDSRPTWAGLWLFPCNPVDFISTPEDLYILGKEGEANVVYKVDHEKTYDYVDDQIIQIKSRIYSREHQFETPFAVKELRSLDIQIEGVKGEFEIEVKFRPAHYHEFSKWQKFSHFIPWCNFQDDMYQGYAPLDFREIKFGSPETKDCNKVTQDMVTWLKGVQLQIDITGINWRLKEYRILGVPQASDNIAPTCTGELPVVPLYNQCNNDWKLGEINGCHPQTIPS